MTTASRKIHVISTVVTLVLTIGGYSGVLSGQARASGRVEIIGLDASNPVDVQPEAAPFVCQPVITSIRYVELQPSGSGYTKVGTLGWITVGDFFSVEIDVMNQGSTAVGVGSPYPWTLSSGQSHVDVVGQPCLCATWFQLQPGQSATLSQFCCQALEAVSAGEVTIDIDLGNCIWSLIFEIQGGGGPVACQPEVTDIRIVKLQPQGDGYRQVGEVSEVTVGDLFNIEIDVTNHGATPVRLTNLYDWTMSGSGHADVVGGVCLGLALYDLQPGDSATLMPFVAACHAFEATTAGTVTMDITIAGCQHDFTFEIKEADTSLVLYLPFDEGAGATANDLSGYHNSGAITDAAWVAGIRGTALQFAGNAQVQVPEIPEYDVTDAVSLLAWVKTTQSPNYGRVLDKSQYQTSGFDLCLTGNVGLPRFEFFVDNSTSAVEGTTAVADNDWHFIAATFGNKTLRMYMDGNREGETLSQMDIKPNNWPVMVGACGWWSPAREQYYGSIDEVMMYDRELSAGEVTAIFQSTMISACQPEVTGIKIVRLRMVGNLFEEVGEVSELSVGQLFTIKVEVTNRGSTPVPVGNPYAWTVVGQSHADVVGSQFCVCAASWQLQPGESATLSPFCEGYRAFCATSPGSVTMDITVGDDCHNEFKYQIAQ